MVTKRTHYEVSIRVEATRWRRLEVQPFSNDYEFPSEQAARDAAEKNDNGLGYRISKVETSRELIFESTAEA